MYKENFFWIIALITFIVMVTLAIYWNSNEAIEKERTKQICLNQGKSVLECKALSE